MTLAGKRPEEPRALSAGGEMKMSHVLSLSHSGVTRLAHSSFGSCPVGFLHPGQQSPLYYRPPVYERIKTSLETSVYISNSFIYSTLQ